MKKLILLLLFPLISMSQELILNSETKVYDYTHVKNFEIPKSDMFMNFEKKMKELNYTDISSDSESISGKNFISFLIMTTPVQVHYKASIDFKEGKYLLTINKFVLEDRRYSQIPLEDLKSYTKKWVKKINEKLPTIINAIESPAKNW